MKADKGLESYNQFALGCVKEVEIKLFLKYLFKLSWLLDGSVHNVFPSPFYCLILISWIVFIALAKVPERQGEYLIIQLLWTIAQLLVTSVSPIYLVGEFHFLYLLFLHLRPSYAAASRLFNLVCVECLQMFKHLHSLREVKGLQDCSKILKTPHHTVCWTWCSGYDYRLSVSEIPLRNLW